MKPYLPFFCAMFAANISYAGSIVPQGKCAFTVASRQTLSAVRSYVENNLHSSHRSYLRVVRTKNNWYAITVGDVPRENFDDIKRRLVSRGEAPYDSYCSNGNSYVRVISPSDYRTASSTSSSSSNNDEALQNTLLGAAVIVGGVACLFTSCLSGDKEPSPSKITFRNSCSRDDVKIAVRYLDTDDRWRTRAWWNFEYGHHSNLAYNDSTLWTKNSIVYYYAETLDGNLTWEGNHVFEYGDDDINMRQHRSNSDTISINLTCEN